MHSPPSSDTTELAQLIRDNQPCVVLTGAGVSTESGVPDFRSASGIWAEFDPREYATLGAFRRDPEKVWRFYAPRFAMLTEAEPNAAHLALAELERALQDSGAHESVIQLQRFKDKIATFEEVLAGKFQRHELTFGRFLGIAEQVCLAGIDNLRQIALALKSLESIDARYIERRLKKLADDPATSPAEEQEVAGLRQQLELRARMERQPVQFLVRELPGLLDAARAALAGFVGSEPEDVVFVPNATTGVNAVVRSMDLRPGDELLATDHAYNACRNALEFVAGRAGARVVVGPVGVDDHDEGRVAHVVEPRVAELRRVRPTARVHGVRGPDGGAAARRARHRDRDREHHRQPGR